MKRPDAWKSSETFPRSHNQHPDSFDLTSLPGQPGQGVGGKSEGRRPVAGGGETRGLLSFGECLLGARHLAPMGHETDGMQTPCG